MSWASERLTSRVEDIAYSLMGLFNVFMPMLYGEGDRAFIRLQEEIMKQSEDYTIFAWKSKGSKSRRGLLADSPSEFENSSRYQNRMKDTVQDLLEYKTRGQQVHIPASLTSRGLLIPLPLLSKNGLGNEVPEPGTTGCAGFSLLNRFRALTPGNSAVLRPGTYLALICRSVARNNPNSGILCIWLQKQPESGTFTRLWPGSVVILPESRASKFKMHTIYVLPSGTGE